MATLPNAQALSEWFAKLDNFVVGCGEAGALVIAHIVKGTPLSTAQLQSLLNSAQKNGELSGLAQTASQVQWDLQQYGIQSQVTYSPGSKLQSIIDTALGQGKPVEIGVSNANASLTGETATGVKGHFIDIIGSLGNGIYEVADPNTKQAVNGGFVQDTISQLENASPFAAIVPTTGAGPGINSSNPNPTLNSTCGPFPNPADFPGGINSPSYSAAVTAWGVCQVNNAGPSQIAGTIFNGLGQSLIQFLSAPFAALGITSFADFMWRALFIGLAIVLLIIGIKAFTTNVGEQ